MQSDANQRCVQPAHSRRPALKRVLLVDPCPLIRMGLCAAISEEVQIDVCGEASSPSEALDLVKILRPELAILDLSFSGSFTLGLIRRMHMQHPDMAILVCSLLNESLFAERAVHAGAMGFVDKCSPVAEVLDAVRRVLAGKVYLSPAVVDRVVAGLAGLHGKTHRGIGQLTDREMEVFMLIGRGLSTGDIAERLDLGVKTIETHREKIKRKLGLSGAMALVLRAVQWSLCAD